MNIATRVIVEVINGEMPKHVEKFIDDVASAISGDVSASMLEVSVDCDSECIYINASVHDRQEWVGGVTFEFASFGCRAVDFVKSECESMPKLERVR